MGRWYNPMMQWLLRSPWHGMLSGNTLLVSFAGRKSGKRFAIPVNYARDGDTFYATSLRESTWWRNLRGGAPVTLRVQGKDVSGRGEVMADGDAVVEGLTRYFETAPVYAKYYGVHLDANGRPDAADIARVARERVVVRVHLN